MGGRGRRPKKSKEKYTTLQKQAKTKNLMSIGRMRLYFYKVSVLHILQHHLMSAG